MEGIASSPENVEVNNLESEALPENNIDVIPQETLLDNEAVEKKENVLLTSL